SSRRRHTRFSRDWSSDVCSSDLEMQARVWLDEASTGNRLSTEALFAVPSEWRIDLINRPLAGLALALYTPRLGPTTPALEGTARSGERRVGKEGEKRWKRTVQCE